MDYKSIVNRPLSKKMKERLLKIYKSNNLMESETNVVPPQTIALYRREMVEYNRDTGRTVVTQKGIDYLKSKGMI